MRFPYTKTGLLVVCALGFLAAQRGPAPQGFVLWKRADLLAYKDKMAKANASTEQMGRFGNHWFLMSYRGTNGEAEVHDKQADVFMIQSGEGTLVVGGEVVGGKATGPGEIRGTSIRNGHQVKVGPGDVMHIPAKTPHQMLVDPGKTCLYFVTKIDNQ